MPLNYSIAMLPNPMDREAPSKAYAKAQINGEMNLKTLSREVSNKCTVHQADVSAVLIASVETMIEALKAGMQVNFGELGKFRLQISSKGAVNAKSFTAAHITGVSIQYVPGEDLQDLFQGLEFNLVASRTAQAALLRAQKEGETIVDLGKEEEEGADIQPEEEV